MQELIEKVEVVIAKYSEQLANYGIKISAARRYFEANVDEFSTSGGSAIFNEIDRIRYRKKEKKNGYNYQNNRYHCIVLTVAPIQKGIVRREFLKEYAFMQKKVERAHIGLQPKKTTYHEQKLLTKIEKRILKIITKAQTSTAEYICKDSLYDAFRYTFPKYGYKHRFLNKNRGTWELIFLALSGIFAFVVAFMIWLVGNI